MPFEVGDVVEVHSGAGVEDWVRIIRSQRLEVPRTTAQTFGASVTSIGANGSSQTVKQDWANPPKSELYEFDGIGIAGGWGRGVDLNVKQPASVDQFGTAQAPTVGVLRPETSPYVSPMMLSLFTVYERQPAVQFTNNLPVSIAPELRWVGWRYELGRMPYGEKDPGSESGYTSGSFLDYKRRGGVHTIVYVGGFSS